MLRIRPYKQSDAYVIEKWIQDRDVFMKWGGTRFGKFPISAEIINNKYLFQNGDCAEPDNFYPWTAVDDENRVVGHFIMRYLHGDHRQLRFGWVIVDRAIRGKGYGTRMLRLGLKYAFEFLGADSVTIGVFEDNAIARHCYRKAGFADRETVRDDAGNIVEMEIRRESFEAPAGAGINDSAAMEKQYKTADKLKTRISIHSKYSTNKQGFGNWITSHYQIREGMSVLELGCGTGEMWVNRGEIISRCSRFVLSDLSEGMLHQAEETLRGQPGPEYRVIDIQDIPFADQTFDAVIANMMLYHVPDLQKGLREVRRVLKADGTFYCATYGENGIMEYICSLFADDRIQYHGNDQFTLQNGAEKLRPVFPEVRKYLYEDSLEVTDAGDLADYIFSLTGMTDLRKLPREKVLSVLERNMRNGVLHVPKEYGMFIARK